MPVLAGMSAFLFTCGSFLLIVCWCVCQVPAAVLCCSPGCCIFIGGAAHAANQQRLPMLQHLRTT